MESDARITCHDFIRDLSAIKSWHPHLPQTAIEAHGPMAGRSIRHNLRHLRLKVMSWCYVTRGWISTFPSPPIMWHGTALHSFDGQAPFQRCALDACPLAGANRNRGLPNAASKQGLVRATATGEAARTRECAGHNGASRSSQLHQLHPAQTSDENPEIEASKSRWLGQGAHSRLGNTTEFSPNRIPHRSTLFNTCDYLP
jgi:hypothetical protein